MSTKRHPWLLLTGIFLGVLLVAAERRRSRSHRAFSEAV
jgi:hypothetical protein